MFRTFLRGLPIVFAIAATPVAVQAQDMDHSGHGANAATMEHGAMDHGAMEGVSGAEDALLAYRAALEARDAAAMTVLFAEDSAIFENGKAEGSFGEYMDHHLGPELKSMKAFTFTDPTLSVTRSSNMAYGHETYGYRIDLADGRVIERDGIATSVLSYDASGWKIVQYHSSSRAPRKP